MASTSSQGGGLSEALQIMAGCPDNPVMSISECVMAAPAGLLMSAGKSTFPQHYNVVECAQIFLKASIRKGS